MKSLTSRRLVTEVLVCQREDARFYSKRKWGAVGCKQHKPNPFSLSKTGKLPIPNLRIWG